MTPELWPVWCWPMVDSFSRIATRWPGRRFRSSRAVARPTIPPPTITMSYHCWAIVEIPPSSSGMVPDCGVSGGEESGVRRRRAAAGLHGQRRGGIRPASHPHDDRSVTIMDDKVQARLARLFVDVRAVLDRQGVTDAGLKAAGDLLAAVATEPWVREV